jgi:O-antigen/teichoic acid export membrane protein
VSSRILNPAPPTLSVEEAPWAKLARVMTTSAAGVVLSGVAGVAATKILATTLGPSAVASLQTLQQARQTAVIAATSNGQTALVQGASSLGGIQGAIFVRTVACIFLIGTSLVSFGLWAASGGGLRWVLERTGLSSMGTPILPWLGIAVAFTSAYVFLTALLNSVGKVGTLAALQVAGPFALAVLAYPAARAGGGRAIAIVVACSAAASAGAGLVAILRNPAPLGAWFLNSRRWWDASSARHFFSISTAMLITGFFASAAVVAVRGNIVRTQGLQRTGLFDAAWSISMNQVTLVLASVQTYYLPALTRARTQTEKTSEISRVLMAGTMAAAIVIAGLALLQPFVLDLFYSRAFQGAHQYLRWTLVGDYLKVSSWILSIPMLAAADMKLFLVSDLAASATFLGTAFLLTRWIEPAESASMAFVLMYTVHLTISLFYVRLRQGIRLGSRTVVCWMAGLALVLTATSLSWKGGIW